MLCAFHVDTGPIIELRPDLVGDLLMGGPDAGEPADIRWVNRANTTAGGSNDTDGFGAVFGANANAARRVVDQVIADFERMITSFNYSDGSSNFDLTVSMGGGQGLGGAASTTSTLGGKPKRGQLTLQTGTNGAGANWFIDPTPNDHSEFLGNIVNAYAGDAQAGSPAAGVSDFYTVAAAEVAHALGLGTNSSLWNNRNTNTNIADNAEGGGIGTFYVFQGNSIRHLLTSNNGGGPPNGSSFNRAIHTAGSGGNINFNGTNWRGAEDAGNALYEFGRRYLVPDVLGLMFRDAYGYDVRVTERDHFYSVLNRNTGVLTIRGGTGLSNDVISINHVADNRYFRVSVDVGADVPGTGALPGAGNLPAFVSGLYDANQINSIVINAGDGNDTININFLSELNALTINAGDGNDTINFAPAGGDMSATLNLNITVMGGNGNDTLRLFDTSSSANLPFTVTNSTVARSFLTVINYDSIESIRIDAGSGNNTFNVQSLAAATSLQLNGGAGNDTFNIGGTLNNVEQVRGPISVAGQNGTDTLNFRDANNTFSDTYTLISTSVTRTAASNVNYFTMETVNLFAGSGHNLINVNHTANGSNTTINAGGGNDTVNVGLSAAATLTINGDAGDDTIRFTNVANLNSTVTVNGGAGTDTLEYNDTNSNAASSYTITSTFVGRDGAGGVSYNNTVQNIVVRAGVLNDQFHINSTAQGSTLTVYGNTGNDVFRITQPSGNLANARGAIVLDGGAGDDTVLLYDHTAGGIFSETTTITATQVTHPNFGPLTYSQMASLVFEGGPGSDIIEIASTAPNTRVTARGNGGVDHFRIGAGDLSNLPAQVNIEGGAGFNTAVVSDAATTHNDGFTVTATQIQRPGFGGLIYSDLATLTVEAGSGNNAFTVNSTSGVTDIRLKGNGGNDFFEVNSTSANKPVIIDVGGGSGNVINSIPATSARLIIENSPTLHSLTLMGNARASLATAGAAMLTQFLTVLGGAQLDIGSAGVIVDYASSSPLPAIEAAITSGYANGLWNGAGIISSVAANNSAFGVGYAESADVLGPAGGTFFGRSVNASAVLIRATLFGDANLDGQVNLADFNRLAANFGASNRSWSHGDFNYDRQINLADFNRLAGNFGASSASLHSLPDADKRLMDVLADVSEGAHHIL